jgi:hypothetical protein
MGDEGYDILWTQVILAAALARTARARLEAQPGEAEVVFSIADTHAGCGRLPVPLARERVLAARQSLGAEAFFAAIAPSLAEGTGHPGSWVLAGRVVGGLGLARLFPEIDVNDIDPMVIETARRHREATWVRFWSHDWFLFLRHRLAMTRRPDFVFIDPPPDDPRGPGYAIDAAILLDALGVPYMITYPLPAAQAPIDQIGRSGLELWFGSGGSGALLGGGAETVLLDVLGDLGRLAALLGGRFEVRLPGPIADDYTI